MKKLNKDEQFELYQKSSVKKPVKRSCTIEEAPGIPMVTYGLFGGCANDVGHKRWRRHNYGSEDYLHRCN